MRIPKKLIVKFTAFSLVILLLFIDLKTRIAIQKFDKLRAGDTEIFVSRIEIFGKTYAKGFFIDDQKSINNFNSSLSKNFDYTNVSCPLSNSWQGAIHFNTAETVNFSISIGDDGNLAILSYPISVLYDDRHYGLRFDRPRTNKFDQFIDKLRNVRH